MWDHAGAIEIDQEALFLGQGIWDGRTVREMSDENCSLHDSPAGANVVN
jgi:hypothetical protein